jgi:hypothetical protein
MSRSLIGDIIISSAIIATGFRLFGKLRVVDEKDILHVRQSRLNSTTCLPCTAQHRHIIQGMMSWFSKHRQLKTTEDSVSPIGTDNATSQRLVDGAHLDSSPLTKHFRPIMPSLQVCSLEEGHAVTAFSDPACIDVPAFSVPSSYEATLDNMVKPVHDAFSSLFDEEDFLGGLEDVLSELPLPDPIIEIPSSLPQYVPPPGADSYWGKTNTYNKRGKEYFTQADFSIKEHLAHATYRTGVPDPMVEAAVGTSLHEAVTAHLNHTGRPLIPVPRGQMEFFPGYNFHLLSNLSIDEVIKYDTNAQLRLLTQEDVEILADTNTKIRLPKHLYIHIPKADYAFSRNADIRRKCYMSFYCQAHRDYRNKRNNRYVVYRHDKRRQYIHGEIVELNII